jgi:hypothetical protein
MPRQNFEQVIAQLNAIPRLQYGYYPTPLEELPRLRATLGHNAPRLFIKRDDYTAPASAATKCASWNTCWRKRKPKAQKSPSPSAAKSRTTRE